MTYATYILTGDERIPAKALYEGCEPSDFKWGRYPLVNSGGCVIVG